MADKRRLARSIFGIAFAVVLMLVEFGFRNAFLESSLQLIRHMDADIVLVSSTKYRTGRQDAFSRRQLYLANSAEGVASPHFLRKEDRAHFLKCLLAIAKA